MQESTLSAFGAGGRRGGREIERTMEPDSTQQGYQSCVKTTLYSLVAHSLRFILLPQLSYAPHCLLRLSLREICKTRYNRLPQCHRKKKK